MDCFFIDSSFFIALVSKYDKWHLSAISIGDKLSKINPLTLVTSNAVLSEVLGFYSSRGPKFMKGAYGAIDSIIREKKIIIHELDNKSFELALELYGKRIDKRYSLVDCFSMNIMLQSGINKIISFDGDFKNEGFEQIKTL